MAIVHVVRSGRHDDGRSVRKGNWQNYQSTVV
jgi:hypothetical protein